MLTHCKFNSSKAGPIPFWTEKRSSNIAESPLDLYKRDCEWPFQYFVTTNSSAEPPKKQKLFERSTGRQWPQSDPPPSEHQEWTGNSAIPPHQKCAIQPSSKDKTQRRVPSDIPSLPWVPVRVRGRSPPSIKRSYIFAISGYERRVVYIYLHPTNVSFINPPSSSSPHQAFVIRSAYFEISPTPR
jgi:hypothetical protein